MAAYVRKPYVKVKDRPPPPEIETFGCPEPGQDQLFYDRWAFAQRISVAEGAPPRSKLFKRISDALVPGWFEWHSWTNRMIEGMCERRWVGMAGCSSAAKTRNVVGFACTWWLASPHDSSVTLCSTTGKMLRKRGWKEVIDYYTSIRGPRLFNMVDSRMMWQFMQGDDRHSISGISVEEGSPIKVADNIKGVHTRRQMLIIDEATSVPAAIYDACSNLYRYPDEFIMVVLGNSRNRLDQHGLWCEPRDGWKSVTVDTDEWETAPKIDGVPALILRFDATKSPNITEGKIVSHHLPTLEQVEARKRSLAHENDPLYWSNERGFWPPEGLSKALLTTTAIEANDGNGRHQFTGDDFRIIGVLDPARTGGDRAAVRFCAIGQVESDEGKGWGIEWMPPQIVPLDAKSSNPIDFQIVDAVKQMALKVIWRGMEYSCAPEDFGLDATGGGADLADIFQRLWSPKIHRIIFSGSPSATAVSLEDQRPADEVYRNKRAEMFFRLRNALFSGQLKGIDRPTQKELCSLEFDDTRGKILIMSKDDYRVQFGESPDLADTGAMTLEMARIKGFRITPLGHTVRRMEESTEEVTNAQAVYDGQGYEPDEMLEQEA